MNTTSFLQFYVHIVWATWNRTRLITPRVEAILRPALLSKATELGCTTVALGMVEDHVHELLALPAVVPLATVAKELKGASSHLINQQLGRGELKWQAGYGGFSVSPGHVDRVAAYVRGQRQHHQLQRLWRSLEQIHPDLPARAPPAALLRG
ncbi:MAG TPA: transposase [Myxococcales bacterium]